MTAKFSLLIFPVLVVAFIHSATVSFPQSSKENRVALLIGNSDFIHVAKLTNPANVASDLNTALRRVGFEVTTFLNSEYRPLQLALRYFAVKVAGADIALAYFAGHGIKIDNTIYIIRVNAELHSDLDVEFKSIRLESITNAIAKVDGLKLVLVDACRNNPFLAHMIHALATRSIRHGLGQIDPGCVMVGYAARGGTLALDGNSTEVCEQLQLAQACNTNRVNSFLPILALRSAPWPLINTSITCPACPRLIRAARNALKTST